MTKAAQVRYAFEIPGMFARGWHIVALSQELKIGDVKSLHYFDQELVLFRGESGKAVVLDAYCPHLGAHLGGTGNKIIGDTIRCPFHGWQFNGEGGCTAIPYAKKIPERARSGALKAWPIVEKNGFIAIWHDREGGTPNWELPDIPEWGPSGWGDWLFNRERIVAHGREIIENIVDVGHFPSVHGGVATQFDNIFTPYSVTQEAIVVPVPEATTIHSSSNPFPTEYLLPMEDREQWGSAVYHGPSVMYFYNRFKSRDLSYQSWWVNYYTPINDTELDLTSAVIAASLDENPLPPGFLESYARMSIAAFAQDVEIWKTKIYRANPMLCDGDGPIHKLRKWYNRFYLPRAEEGWDEPAERISSVRN
jgi:3-ketosteroid 9alpha-monooxygenase subunit A